ncbi:hypothetical protein L484_006883 [Morus notabilis]|uniref:Uncharacterized protein n=1 Tax=Morus notabilis TaxID=981085 RepID=W9S4Q5_9ROSA|nr:hypothetical protein L484_006883 [Morus notabilis]
MHRQQQHYHGVPSSSVSINFESMKDISLIGNNDDGRRKEIWVDKENLVDSTCGALGFISWDPLT